MGKQICPDNALFSAATASAGAVDVDLEAGKSPSLDMAFDLDGGRYDAWTTISSSAPGVPVFGFLAVEADFGPGSVGETFPHFYNRVRTPKAD